MIMEDDCPLAIDLGDLPTIYFLYESFNISMVFLVKKKKKLTDSFMVEKNGEGDGSSLL